MYSKRLLTATCALALLASCVRLPWRDEPVGTEVNLAFTVEKNLLVITTATIQGRAGRFVFGSAERRTLVDASFAQSLEPPRRGRLALQIGEKETLGFTPLVTDLRGVGDAILGADVWANRAVTIDYHAGLVIYQKEGIHPASMTLYRWNDLPKINVIVDGRRVSAIVDTASPDTLTLPRGGAAAHRENARLNVAGTDLGTVDIALADVTAARVGNRVLSKFLVTIDYGRREVGLWRDPRIAP
jgi:hypothetical protein